MNYLLALSIGPVQSLIEAGRRTRDLWCGSWLLSEVAKAAALYLHQQQPGCLIFPYVENPQEQAPALLQTQTHFSESPANIANIIRAHVACADLDAVRLLAENSKQAANAKMVALCKEAKKKLQDVPIHEDIWQNQQQDILEIYSGWVAVKPNQYAAAAQRLGALLSSRKSTRTFAPMASTRAGIPKSSLDGARESVINLSYKKRDNGSYRPMLNKLGLSDNEDLDLLGVVKRLAGDADQFTPFSRIVAHPWVTRLQQDISLPKDTLHKLCEAYKLLVENNIASRVNSETYQQFPYDADLLFKGRLEHHLNQPPTQSEERKKYAPLREVIKTLPNHPLPYGVLLKADGDKMGELLNKASDAASSRKISAHLHQFASSVRETVKGHNGHGVYAGGDDVLAFLPLDSALACAQDLAQQFATAMQNLAKELNAIPPTLSVGLAIGHAIQPMGLLRRQAIAAEKLAKGDVEAQPRNALAIQLNLRSGAQIQWRCRWDDPDLHTLSEFMCAFEQNQCPARLGYSLRSLAQQLPPLGMGVVRGGDSPLPKIHQAELQRLLQRARPGNATENLSRELTAKLLERAEKVGLAQLAEQLIIARWLSAKTSSDLGSAADE